MSKALCVLAAVITASMLLIPTASLAAAGLQAAVVA